jgi:hypothetical protein
LVTEQRECSAGDGGAEPADVAPHVELFAALAQLGDFGDPGRAALAEIRAGYAADAGSTVRP